MTQYLSAIEGASSTWLSAVVSPMLRVNAGCATPLGGVNATSRSCGTGSPPPSIEPAISVWKLTFTSPLGKCTVRVPGMGTSPASAESLAQLRVVLPPQSRRRGTFSLGRFRGVQLGVDPDRVRSFVAGQRAH